MTERSTERPTGPELVIERTFAAPRELVFRAWTDRAHMLSWFGPRGFTVPFLELDIRPGGAWRACMRSPQGVEYWVSGIYLEIVPFERLAFTYAGETDGRRGPETKVVLELSESGGKTTMTFRQAPFETAEIRDDHDAGWNEAFDKLGESVARG